MKKIFLLISIILFNITCFAQTQQWEHYHYVSNAVSGISEEGEYLWLLTHPFLIKMHKVTGEKSFYCYLDSSINATGEVMMSIAVDNHGNKWLGGKFFLLKFDNNNNWTKYELTDFMDTTQNFNFDGGIQNMCVDKDNNLWLGYDHGVMKFSEIEQSAIGYCCIIGNLNQTSLGGSAGIMPDSKNNIWAVSSYGSFSKFDGSQWIDYASSVSNYSSNPHYHGMTVDKNDNIWLGLINSSCKNGRLIRVNDNDTINYNNNIVCLSEYFDTVFPTIDRIGVNSDGTIWIGVSDSGLLKYNEKEKECQLYSTDNSILLSNYFNKIFVDSEDNTWVGTRHGIIENVGLFKITKDTMQVFNLNYSKLVGDNNVSGIDIDSDNNKWIVQNGNNSLLKFDGKNWTAYEFPALDNYAKYNPFCTKVEGNSKWVGTDKGVLKLNGDEWTVYDTKNSGIANNKIIKIETESTGVKWIITNSGISRFDNNNWQNFTATNIGLVGGGSIASVSIDAYNNKWFATEKGLVKYDDDKWTVYDTENSNIPSNNIRDVAIDSENNVWLINSSSVTMLNGETFTPDSSGISFSSISIDKNDNKWMSTSKFSACFGKLDNDNEFTFFSNAIMNNIRTPIIIDKYNNKWMSGYCYGTPSISVFNETGISNIETYNIDIIPDDVAVFPNPTRNEFEVLLANNEPISAIEIINLQSCLLYKKEINNISGKINIEHLPTGMYLVKIISENGKVNVKKILKE